MAVKIRLARMGSKKKPFYRVVAASSTSPRDGKFLEKLGTYNPVASPAVLELDMDKVDYWVSHGAIPTNTVSRLLKSYNKAAV